MRMCGTFVPLVGAALSWLPAQNVGLRMITTELLTTVPSEPLVPGDQRSVGNCVVQRSHDSITLFKETEPDNIQSEWHVPSGSAPDYAGCIGRMAREALESQSKTGGRVLMLGLGGGSIVADIMCGSPSIDWSIEVTAVEYDQDVAVAACCYFLPAMFSENPRVGPGGEQNMRDRLHVLQGDARRVVDESVPLPKDAAGPFDVIIEDFAYERYGMLSIRFWSLLRERHAAPNATLLINTLFDHHTGMEKLARDLRKAGWSDVREHVNKGLNADEGQSKVVDPMLWEPGDNMILSAVNRQDPAAPRRSQ